MSSLCSCGSGQRNAASADDAYDDANDDEVTGAKGSAGVAASKVRVSVAVRRDCIALVHRWFV